MGLISKLSKDEFIKEFFDAWSRKSSSRLGNLASNVYAEIEAKDKRIAELESCTCENCNYIELDEDPNNHKLWGTCGNKSIPFFPEGIDFKYNFGCNKFERKDKQ